MLRATSSLLSLRYDAPLIQLARRVGRRGLAFCERDQHLALAVAVAPSLIDFVSGFVGGPSLGNVPRLIVALPGGMMLGWFLGEGLSDIGERAHRSGTTPWSRRTALTD